MKKRLSVLKTMLLALVIGATAVSGFAEDEVAGTTEITGYYQQYRDFSFDMGGSELGAAGINFSPTRLGGGGFSVAQNIADWFALWTQLTIYGSKEQLVDIGDGYLYQNSVRVIHNLEGIRYQTKQYGPLRLYFKAGAGFAYYSLNVLGFETSGTKFSAGYGGGANIWLHKHLGITLDVSHVVNGLPNLFDVDSAEGYDSGLVYTTGLTFRF